MCVAVCVRVHACMRVLVIVLECGRWANASDDKANDRKLRCWQCASRRQILNRFIMKTSVVHLLFDYFII